MSGEQKALTNGSGPTGGQGAAGGPPCRAEAVDATDLRAAARTGRPPGLPQSAAAARDTVTRLLEAHFCALDEEGLADVVVADALLVTSELVTNAIRHGGGLTGFRAEITDDGLLLTVADASPRAPVTAERDPSDVPAGGYGWLLVRRLAKRVSVTCLPGGKRIVALVALF
jgi:anti-sigma regulatory factor (Ser/Thr protein kinase)